MSMLKKTESKYRIGEKDRIKFIETSGRRYVDFFKSLNPFRKRWEPELKCLLCSTSSREEDCKVTNIGYSITCLLCRERQRKVHYFGESSRNCLLRGSEHFRDYEKKSKNSVMWKHVSSEHKDEQKDVKFEMNITGKFNSALARQIHEARNIRNENPANLMNSKSEFYRPCIKRKVYSD